MRKLIISLVTVLVGVFIADRLGGVFMSWVNQHSSDITAPKVRYLVSEVKEDVLL